MCVGRLKEPGCSLACDEYLKRLRRYVKVEVVELRECTDKNPEVAKRKEGERIMEKLDDTHAVALDKAGRGLSSEEFPQLLKKQDITFIIGGPDGLSPEVLGRTDMTLSLSKMTFPHQLARVMLLEQIYRGYTILKGERYHR